VENDSRHTGIAASLTLPVVEEKRSECSSDGRCLTKQIPVWF